MLNFDNIWDIILPLRHFACAAVPFCAGSWAKKLISHLTIFDYITGITIGSIAAELATQQQVDYVKGVTALAGCSLRSPSCFPSSA